MSSKSFWLIFLTEMKLTGWNGRVPVLSNCLMEEDGVFSSTVQGFSLFALFTVFVQYVMLQHGVDQQVWVYSFHVCCVLLIFVLQNLWM